MAVPHESHPRPTLLSDFILGSQDGIVNVLGIILGLSAATHDVRLILVATLAAMGAESIAMGAVAYTSTRTRRRLYLSEVERERQEMRDVPETERGEIRAVLAEWGYSGSDLEELLNRLCGNPRAMLEFMMAFELKLAPVAEGAPTTSAWIVGTATVLGHFLPLAPFLFVGGNVLLGATLSVGVSGASLFAIGWYEAKVTAGRWWRNGAQMVLIGLAGGLAGFLIGHFLGASPGL
ncbi:MAG TPA: VIT1/CCC1 transporter family protein [Thermoplasmata archaeon]|nr:VIT1/CCC1 transporter family protein [Thermoplasmata archaeon]